MAEDHTLKRSLLSWVKGTVRPKLKILSSFTHPRVVPDLNECVCSEHKGRYSEVCGTQSSFLYPAMEVNGAPTQPDYKLSSKYLPLCSEQTHSFRSGTTRGWVNDDRIFRFGWTVPLSLLCACSKFCVNTQCHIKARLNYACSDPPQALVSKHCCFWVNALMHLWAALNRPFRSASVTPVQCKSGTCVLKSAVSDVWCPRTGWNQSLCPSFKNKSDDSNLQSGSDFHQTASRL